MGDFLANVSPNETTSGILSVITPFNETRKHPEPDPIISNPFIISISLASVVGNVAMVLMILCNQRFRKLINLLVANLSFSSLLFIISTNLRLAENSFELWTYSDSICQGLAIAHRVPIPVIALSTMAISLDRGSIARNPMLGSNGPNPIFRILLIWIFSIVIVLPLGLTRVYDSASSLPYKCGKVVMLDSPTFAMLYGITYLLSVHIIPAAILARETTKTINKIKFLKINEIMNPLTFPVLPDNRLRLLRNSCIFSGFFLLFWLPYGIFQFPFDLPKQVLPDIFAAYVQIYFKFCRNVTYTLIALNPVILFVLSYDIFKHIPFSGNSLRLDI